MSQNHNSITYRPIGVIRSPFKQLSEMPIQPSSDISAPGSVEIYPDFIQGLVDLDGFSHIILIYHFHLSRMGSLTVVPFLDSKPHGVFATRAPNRPNAIGLSVVKLVNVNGNVLFVDNLDILDGTPLLDIKPFIPEFDSPPSFRLGWLENKTGKTRTTYSDERFK